MARNGFRLASAAALLLHVVVVSAQTTTQPAPNPNDFTSRWTQFDLWVSNSEKQAIAGHTHRSGSHAREFDARFGLQK
jgi:hypothetical protein